MGIFSYIQGQRLFALCVLVAALWSCVATALPEYELLQVQVLHRHGARSPLVDHNQTAICGTRYPCGFLNEPGQKMLVNVGRFLRERYTKDAEVVDPAAPFLSSDGYNLTVSYSRSTDVLRTLQSSDALLRGMFPDMDAYYPAIHTVDPSTDVLLSTGAKPFMSIGGEYNKEEERIVAYPIVDRYFPVHERLIEIGREVYSEGYCENPKKRHKCAKKMCSIAQSYESQGTLDQYPLLRANMKGLCAVTLHLSRYYFSYSPLNPVHVQQGSMGFDLASHMVQQAQAAAAATSAAATASAAVEEVEEAGSPARVFKVRHYSAHDSTLSPFAATLRDESDDGMMPPYASTYVLELLRRRSTGDSSEGNDDSNTNNNGEEEEEGYYVRVLRGFPGVTPESNYTFAFRPFSLRCMSASYVTYIADDNTCPLADFARLIDSTRPRSEAGTCYIDPVIWKRLGCRGKDDDGSGDGDDDGAEELSPDCRLYRQLCPKFACAEGYTVDAATLRCRRVLDGTNSSSTGDGGTDNAGRGGGSGEGLLPAVCTLSLIAGCVLFFIGIDVCIGPCGGAARGMIATATGI